MSAVSATEKVDGFTRRSVKKAQKQRKSPSSSRFRSHSSSGELSALPQLRANVHGKRISRDLKADVNAEHF